MEAQQKRIPNNMDDDIASMGFSRAKFNGMREHLPSGILFTFHSQYTNLSKGFSTIIDKMRL